MAQKRLYTFGFACANISPMAKLRLDLVDVNALVLDYIAGDRSQESTLVAWLTNYAYGAIWAMRLYLTTEERQDLASVMLVAGMEMLTRNDLSERPCPAGLVIAAMRRDMLDSLSKSIYRTRRHAALTEWARENKTDVERLLRRQCLEKDKYREYGAEDGL